VDEFSYQSLTMAFLSRRGFDYWSRCVFWNR